MLKVALRHFLIPCFLNCGSVIVVLNLLCFRCVPDRPSLSHRLSAAGAFLGFILYPRLTLPPAAAHCGSAGLWSGLVASAVGRWLVPPTSSSLMPLSSYIYVNCTCPIWLEHFTASFAQLPVAKQQWIAQPLRGNFSVSLTTGNRPGLKWVLSRSWGKTAYLCLLMSFVTDFTFSLFSFV